MNLSRIVTFIIGVLLAFSGVFFALQNLGFNLNLLVGLVVTVIGVAILLGRGVNF